eukprot:6651896-Heterocapsa_arctica.AAC.1
MKQNHPDKHTKDKDGIRAERYGLHQSKTDKGVRSNIIMHCLLVSNNDKHSSRVGSVWVKHLFNEIAYAAQPLIVVQGPCIRWSLRWSACVAIHKHSGEI